MKITSENFYDLVLKGQHKFYRATQAGVEECNMVTDTKSNFIGFVCGPIFTAVKLEGSALWAFDSRGAEYCQTEMEAVYAHRKQVIQYLQQLNNSSLQTFPILYGDPSPIK